MNTIKTWVAAAALVALTGAAQAALISQSDGTVKDDITHLVWLQNWNVNGQKNWATQMAWAEGLDFAGSKNWALPTLSQYQTLSAEVGNLQLVTQFTNVQGNSYWSSTEWEIAPTYGAYFLRPTNGSTYYEGKPTAFFAVAVRTGDVAASVPEPGSMALAGLALIGLACTRRRRR